MSNMSDEQVQEIIMLSLCYFGLEDSESTEYCNNLAEVIWHSLKAHGVVHPPRQEER